MHTLILTIHILLALFLVGLVLLQRSEGGALGGLGGATGASFMTGRAVGNMLTKTTAIVAILFAITALALGIMARRDVQPASVLDVPVAQTAPAPAPTPAPASVPASLPKAE